MGIVIRLIIGALGLVVFSAPAYAHDMSGWTDKTICRLVKKQGADEYIKEAKARNLSCAADKSSKVKTTSNQDPLLSLKIPQNWKMADKPLLMEHEINAVSKAYKYWRFPFGDGGSHATCEEVMVHWDEAIKFSIKYQNQLEPQSFREKNKNPPPNIDKCIEEQVENIVSKGGATNSLSNILLAWANKNNVTLPKRAGNNTDQYNYQATSSWSGYASVYAIYYDSFDYTDEERKLVDDYLASSLKKLTFNKNLSTP